MGRAPHATGSRGRMPCLHQAKPEEPPTRVSGQHHRTRGLDMIKATIVGNIGTEPEMRYTAAGQSLLAFSVASTYRTKNQAGEWVDKAEWVRCTVFGKRAETLSQYLHKG